jgi:hypothetical protein
LNLLSLRFIQIQLMRDVAHGPEAGAPSVAEASMPSPHICSGNRHPCRNHDNNHAGPDRDSLLAHVSSSATNPFQHRNQMGAIKIG